MKRLFAYAFQTHLPLTQIALQLGEAGGWRWMEREGERWGDYLSTVGVPGATVKIFMNEPTPGTCAVSIRFESDAPDAQAQAAAIERRVLDAVLPAIGAHAIVATDYFE
jgi:hypothetical protein